MVNKKEKSVAVILTFFVLGILLASGPADAFTISLNIPNNEVVKGKTINFTSSININDYENLPMDYLLLELSGPEKVSCKFLPNGTIISGCKDIKIDLLESPGYGYGYGYGQYNNLSYNFGYGYGFSDGKLMYNFTMRTIHYTFGTYKTSLKVVINGNEFSNKGKNIMIKSGGGSGEQDLNINGCSIRAKNGEVYIQGDYLGDNSKISFNFNLKNAVNGKGTLTAQKGKTRISYKFNVVEILDSNDSIITIKVKGDYKVNRSKKIQEEAVIYIDKEINTINLVGEDIEINDMFVTFNTKCNLFNPYVD
ncbi:MAG: hypothetical protein WC438_00155 [Candidatus Pacearchaeota archaeon]